MVWTEVSPLLAAVAVILVAVALLAILFGEIKRPKGSELPHAAQRGLPANAELSDEERRAAMHYFAEAGGAKRVSDRFSRTKD